MANKKVSLVLWLVLAFNGIQAQQKFTSLNELLAFAKSNSINVQNSAIKLEQAQKGKLAAQLSIPDVYFNINTSLTNNTKLPVSILPGEAFGGQPGTTKEIKTGTPYASAFGQSLDIKLINMEGWQNLKLAKLNTAIAENDVTIIQKTLQESITVFYFTIVQLQSQKSSTQKNIAIADTLLNVAFNKYKAGLSNQQSVNEAKINLLHLQENERQITYLIEQNYLQLKNIIDLPVANEIIITEKTEKTTLPSKENILQNMIGIKTEMFREQYAVANLKKAKYALWPTLSFFAGNNYNQFNNNFTYSGGNWINSQFVGLKLNFTLPNANTIANKTNAQFTFRLAQQAVKQAKLKAENESVQLDNDWQKANSQYNNNKAVLALQQDTYQKNYNLYKESLIGIDKVITSLNNVINAEYALTTSKVNLLLASAKIDINNKLQ
jgi:outer membrane protein TolC